MRWGRARFGRTSEVARVDLVNVENLLCVRPPTAALNVNVGQWLLAGFAECPPFLCPLVSSHSGHVASKVRSNVFKVAEEVKMPVGQLTQKDGIIADVGLADLPQHVRPHGGVKSFVFGEFFGADFDEMGVALHRCVLGSVQEILSLSSWQQSQQVLVRAGDDFCCDEFAALADSLCSGFESGFHGGHIAFDNDGNVSGADLFLADQLNIGGFEHGVGGVEDGGEALGFEDAEGGG